MTEPFFLSRRRSKKKKKIIANIAIIPFHE